MKKFQSSKEREQYPKDQEDEHTSENDLLVNKKRNIMKCFGISNRI